MINKRLLVKNLLAHTDENSFYDKKRQLNFGIKEGKAKFLKHVCALGNSNPKNDAFIIIGVDDDTNRIKGVPFFDDSKIQNLVNAYLENPPLIQYENISFPKLSRDKVIGLVTIQSKGKTSYLKKGIWKYPALMKFFRRGSNSNQTFGNIPIQNGNSEIVTSITRYSKSNIKYTLDRVFSFFQTHNGLQPKYHVFREQFVLCWAGKEKRVEDKVFYSRVDIELINEEVKLFYSDMDEVKIEYNEQSFIITEYIHLGIGKQNDFYPLEKVIITFKDNGKYNIVNKVLFKPPKLEKNLLENIFQRNEIVLEKLKLDKKLSSSEINILIQFPTTYLICYLNGFRQAKYSLHASKIHLKKLKNPFTYEKYKDVLRVIRKVKYESK